jgi:hypothetical protein
LVDLDYAQHLLEDFAQRPLERLAPYSIAAIVSRAIRARV